MWIKQMLFSPSSTTLKLLWSMRWFPCLENLWSSYFEVATVGLNHKVYLLSRNIQDLYCRAALTIFPSGSHQTRGDNAVFTPGMGPVWTTWADHWSRDPLWASLSQTWSAHWNQHGRHLVAYNTAPRLLESCGRWCWFNHESQPQTGFLIGS